MSTASPSPARPRRRAVRRPVRVLVALLVVLVLAVVAFLVYAHDVMPGDREDSLSAWRDPAVSIRDEGDALVMTPTDDATGVGLVFVPGAKVDPGAYLATFDDVAAAGTTVVVTKPTLNLAILDVRPLATFTALAPEVDTWTVGGHSLGGVRACQLASDAEQGAQPAVSGLLLLGSYCLADLSGSDLDVLSLAGSEDALSTPADVEDRRGSLPDDADLVVLPGVSHAQFGSYGRQPGDGTPTVDRYQARELITSEVRRWAAGVASGR